MSDQKIEGKLEVTDKVGIGSGIGAERPEVELHISQPNKESKIYVASGGNLLQVAAEDKRAFMGTIGNRPLDIQTNEISRIFISENGFVGIGGKTNPAFNLDVNGIINATQFYKGGVPWKVTGNEIESNTITAANIQNGAVTRDKLDPSISFDLADGAVTTPKIANGAVIAAKIADNSVSTVKIQNKAIAQEKLADGSVGTAQLVNNAVTTDKIADKSITAAKLNFSISPGSSQWQGVDGGPISYSKGNVGIGTTSAPLAKLQVADGAIMPSAGNSETAGIMFPKDPFGGSGDAAWIRYYKRGDSGEATTFEIGTSNDADDHIALMPSLGNVGIGTTEPQGKLDVRGDIRAGNSDIYFTKIDHDHTGIGNTKGFAAIENAANFNALMILGRAGTPKGRYVRLWDYLQVNGGMDITDKVGIGTTNPEALLHVFSPTDRLGGNIKFFPTSGKGRDFSYDGGNDSIFAFTHYGAESGELRFEWEGQNNQIRGLLFITNKGEVRGKLVNTSSRDLKENITDFSTQEAIETLADLNPVKFNYREDKEKELKVGFIAEDVPDLLATHERKGVCALEIVAVLTKVIKEQQEELSLLRERVNALEARA